MTAKEKKMCVCVRERDGAEVHTAQYHFAEIKKNSEIAEIQEMWFFIRVFGCF